MTDETNNQSKLKRWEHPDHYHGASWPDYFRAGVGRSRDSDALERSNFSSMLAALGGESETVLVVHEGHWAVGWVEWIAIHETNQTAIDIAEKILEKLEDYPVIDEEHFSELEHDEADEVWRECYGINERIKYIKQNPHQFEFHDYQDMLGCVRGRYFAGSAGELLS